MSCLIPPSSSNEPNRGENVSPEVVQVAFQPAEQIFVCAADDQEHIFISLLNEHMPGFVPMGIVLTAASTAKIIYALQNCLHHVCQHPSRADNGPIPPVTPTPVPSSLLLDRPSLPHFIPPILDEQNQDEDEDDNNYEYNYDSWGW